VHDDKSHGSMDLNVKLPVSTFFSSIVSPSTITKNNWRHRLYVTFSCIGLKPTDVRTYTWSHMESLRDSLSDSNDDAHNVCWQLLIWQFISIYTICTSGFMDVVTFARNWSYGGISMPLQRVTSLRRRAQDNAPAESYGDVVSWRHGPRD